jgi:hypothetical protein
MTNNFVKLLEIFDVATKAVNEGRLSESDAA